MQFGLSVELEVTLEHLVPEVLKIDQALRTFFAAREYGADLAAIAIGVILTDPGSDHLHPPRPFSYSRLERVRHADTGAVSEVRNCATWDVKPDYAAFSKMTAADACDYLCRCIYASAACLEIHHDQYPDFRMAPFVRDLATCLQSARTTAAGRAL